MEKIFYKRWSSVGAVVALLVVVLLICMLLTFLAQMASFDQRIEKLNSLIAQAKADIQTQQELIDFKNTNEYVIEWAVKNGRINEDDYLFIKNLK